MTKPPTLGQLIDQLERIRIKYRAQSEIANRLKAEYDDLEQILAELRLAGESVQDLEVVQPDLQDVFMQVMTRH